MTTHELKCWPEYFAAIISGEKPFEMRRNDRNYRVGDTLHLREWLPHTQKYSGRSISVRVTSLVSLNHLAGWGIDPDWVVMGIADGYTAALEKISTAAIFLCAGEYIIESAPGMEAVDADQMRALRQASKGILLNDEFHFRLQQSRHIHTEAPNG